MRHPGILAAVLLLAAPASAQLAPLDISKMRPWKFDSAWHASDWKHDKSPIPWKFDRVRKSRNGDVLFTLDAGGAPELQAGGATPAYSSGKWQADVTLPKLKPGLIVAPLWIYNSKSRDELDFEYVGTKGLQVAIHVYAGGRHRTSAKLLFPGVDMSGQRHRFGIEVDAPNGLARMYVDDVLVHTFDRRTLTYAGPDGRPVNYFLTTPLKPWFEMWPANPGDRNFVKWVGTWQPLAPGEKLVMTVHGYGYRP